MRRDGTNLDDVQPDDVLCDFCGDAAWAAEQPCIEGHHGSIICGNCLSVAWKQIQIERLELPSSACTMCLESRDEPCWHGARAESHICKRCIKQAAGALHKSKDWDWAKPLPDAE
jgi:hypothetical protein